MSSAGASPSLADRLVAACRIGDLPSAKTAVADGASVNEAGWCNTTLPLVAAVLNEHHDVVVWLLSRGADPNGDCVMANGADRVLAINNNATILQLLIDAGGDVNRSSSGRPPLFTAVNCNSQDKVRMLLAQPSLDFTVTYEGQTPEQYARAYGTPALTALITHEVSGRSAWRTTACGSVLTVCWRCCRWQIARRATLVRLLFFRLIAHMLCSRQDEAGCGGAVVAVGRAAA